MRRKGQEEQRPPRTLAEVAASGAPLFSEKTKAEFEAYYGPEGAKAHEENVRQAILTGKTVVRNIK